MPLTFYRWRLHYNRCSCVIMGFSCNKGIQMFLAFSVLVRLKVYPFTLPINIPIDSCQFQPDISVLCYYHFKWQQCITVLRMKNEVNDMIFNLRERISSNSWFCRANTKRNNLNYEFSCTNLQDIEAVWNSKTKKTSVLDLSFWHAVDNIVDFTQGVMRIHPSLF